MLKRLFWAALLALLLSTEALAERGLQTLTNCDNYENPEANASLCHQTTSAEGRTAGHVYSWDGSAWIDLASVAAPGTGDIEGVTAGTNLTGGGTSGTVTLNVANPLVGNVTGNLTGNVTGNASTATTLATNPTDCAGGEFANAIDASGNLTCATPAGGGGSGDIEGVTAGTNLTGGGTSGTVTLNVANPLVGNVTGNITGNVTGALTGNASTATALAANPTDCAEGQFANAIDAGGNLTCATAAGAGDITGVTAGTNLTGGGSSGEVTLNVANPVVANLTGNASTATALAANPAPCSAGTFVTDIAADGTLTCDTPPTEGGGGTGDIEGVTASDGLEGGGTTGTVTLKAASTINAQTGTTYTVVDGDRAKLVTLANADAVNITLPNAAGAGFDAGWFASFVNLGVGEVSISPVTSTFQDAETTLELTTGQFAEIRSDGTNYVYIRGGLITEADTPQTVYGRGKTSTHHNSFANAARWEDGSGNGIAFYTSGGTDPKLVCYIAGVENDCDHVIQLGTGKSFILQNASAVELGKITEAGVATGVFAGGGAGAIKSLTFIIGSDSGSVLADTDDQATIFRNNIAAMTLTEVWCETDAGSSIINLQRDDGSPANVLSSNLTCTPSGVTGTIASAEDNFAVGDKLDFVMVTAGGVPKRMTLNMKFTVD